MKFSLFGRSMVLVLIVIVLLDVLYTFYLYFHQGLDGDLAAIVVPSAWYRTVLSDPFGIKALLTGQGHAGVNRFFIHWSMHHYFLRVPIFLQSFCSPIDSVYAAVALFKTAVQVSLISLFGYNLQLAFPGDKGTFWWGCVLVLPFFQAAGFYSLMGLVDHSVTYTFFYAFPMVGLLLFFSFFFEAAWTGRPAKLHWWQHAAAVVLTVVLPFSGSLISPLILLICPAWLCLSIGHTFRNGKEATASLIVTWLYFFLISLIGLYSFYLGSYNPEQQDGVAPPFTERYIRLAFGLVRHLTNKLGYPLLLLVVLGNAWLIGRMTEDTEVRKLKRFLLALGVFILIYLLLLPLGGFREYRPEIVRRDTLLPILLGLLGYVVFSTYFLFRRCNRWYRLGFTGVWLIFILVDTPDFTHYRCERSALEKIAQAKTRVVLLEASCPVMAWDKLVEPEASAVNGQLLHYWGIMDQPRLYYQR